MFRFFFLSIIVVNLAAQTVHAGLTDHIDFKTYKPEGVNITAEYLDLFEKKPDVGTALKGTQVLFIEGIMANYVHLMGDLIMKQFGTYTYFDEQEAYVRSIGLGVTRVKLETENSAVKNSIVVANAIRKETKPIILLTHSKGGVDAMMALLNNPDLVQKVVGIVSLQSPFLGTPVADYLETTQPWKAIAYLSLAVMGGSGESLKDLSTAQRIPWYQKNQAAIMKLQSQIPILSFASHKMPEAGNKDDTVFKFSRDIMLEKMNAETDGLVPWKSAILPGGPYIAIEGVDHAASVSKTKQIALDQLKFTRAIFGTFAKVVNHFTPAE
ncbi:MAG: hypothetical protein ABL958_02235 [Bdellovibrionia bacterium]